MLVALEFSCFRAWNGVTGENLHVDAGYHAVGMKAPDAPDLSIVKEGEE